jgi:hypothetical protein
VTLRSRDGFALVIAITLVVLTAGCNRRAPVHDNDILLTAPSGFTNATALEPPGGDLAAVSLPSPIVTGAASGRGAVLLDGPATGGGRIVELRSLSEFVTLAPAVVTVPSGQVSADFGWSTTSPVRDTDVTITASTADRTRSTQLVLWAPVLPNFYSWMADRSGLTSRQFGRVTSDRGGQFAVSCSGNILHATAVVGNTQLGVARFAAAGGRPMARGVYENATPNLSGPRMELDAGFSCAYVGRFEVRELEMFSNGNVTNFWVSFEARCPGREGVVRGDFRGTNMPRTSSVTRLVVCPGGQ